MISPSPPRPRSPACSLNQGYTPSHAKMPRRVSFEVSHIPRTSLSMDSPSGATIVATAIATPRSSPHRGVVDLTDSPVPSPRSSNPSLSLPPSSLSVVMPPAMPAPKGNRSKSPARQFQTLTTSQSTPEFLAPAPSMGKQAPPSSAGRCQHRRSAFILPSDGDSDRDRDQGEVHEESDDSDRTSFVSTEEILVPTIVLNADGERREVQDSRVVQQESRRVDFQSLLPELDSEPNVMVDDTLEHHATNKVSYDQDAAHGLRRWHALMEIVHTEAGYVRDMRVLVNLYLAHLPSLPLSVPAQQAVQGLSRMASELLALHERFLLALENGSAQVAGGASPIGSVDEAVRKVASLFIEEASSFDLYQDFCAVQPDVLRLLRPAQARAEWGAFEQRCAAGGDEAAESDTSLPSKVSQTPESSEIANGESTASPHSAPASTTAATAPTHLPRRRVGPSRTLSLMPSAFKAYAYPSPTSQTTDFPHNTRRHSYDSLAAVFSASGSGNMRNRPGVTTPSSDGSTSTTYSSKQNSKLRFHDFLIKPVQRICKYPLMLEALRGKTHEKSVDAIVATAVEDMRAVVTRVDEARRRKEAAARSKLIADRIEPHAVMGTDFIKSLGDCLLAGSLDVVHHHHVFDPVTTPVRVRYLGAFLYLGGYLLLVKVSKGKVYRIKHWFSLAPFEVVDIPRDIALVSCSFRLSHMDHHFEIAAACQREKDLWMRAINEARCAHPVWTSEPISSLQLARSDRSGSVLMADNNNNTLDIVEPPANLTRGPSSSSIVDQSNPLAALRRSTTRGRMPTSNSAVRVFSFTDGSSIILRRSSATNRGFVDRGLVDVLSDLVASLRKQALAHEEVLFSPPPSSDSPQTVSNAAKNRLMRGGGMLVARPRSLFIPGTVAVDCEEDVSGQPSSSTIRRKHAPTSRSRMSLLPALSMLYNESGPPDYQGTVSRPELQIPKSGTSFEKSHSPSGVKSLPCSPIIGNRHHIFQSSSEVSHDNSRNHRRTRSLVGSVRDLVRRATTKRTSTQPAPGALLLPVEDNSSDAGDITETTSTSSTSRRRVSSAPATPPLSTASALSHSNFSLRSQSTIIDCPNSMPDSPSPSSIASASKPVEKSHRSVPSNPDYAINPRRNFKSFIFYNRLSSVDSA